MPGLPAVLRERVEQVQPTVSSRHELARVPHPCVRIAVTDDEIVGGHGGQLRGPSAQDRSQAQRQLERAGGPSGRVCNHLEGGRPAARARPVPRPAATDSARLTARLEPASSRSISRAPMSHRPDPRGHRRRPCATSHECRP